MPSIGLKKKKRNAAKKKKKNNKAKKNKSISIHSPTNVQEEDDLETEESLNGCLSKELIPGSELISQSQSMEGSGNDGTEPVIVEKEEVVKEVESIGDSANRSISIDESADGGSLVDGASSSTSHEEPQVVEKMESLENEKGEVAKPKEEDGNSIVEFVEKAVSEMVGADNVEKIASVTEKVIPIIEEGIKKETEVKMMLSKVLETIPVQKTKALDFVDSVSKENEDRLVSSSDNPRIETSHRTEEQTDAPFGQAMVQRTTWKSCCGLLDVLTGSNR